MTITRITSMFERLHPVAIMASSLLLAAAAQASPGGQSPPSADGQDLLLLFAGLNAAIILAAAARKFLAKRQPAQKERRAPQARATTFVIKNDTFDIPEAQDRVRELAEGCSLPIKTVFDLCLLAEEMLSHVIAEGFDEDQRGVLTVTMAVEKDSARLTVEYQGREVNPLHAPVIDMTKPLEDLPLDGWDLHLLRLLADEIDFERQGQRNILTAVKKWEPGALAA